jgi:hypothetical protein
MNPPSNIDAWQSRTKFRRDIQASSSYSYSSSSSLSDPASGRRSKSRRKRKIDCDGESQGTLGSGLRTSRPALEGTERRGVCHTLADGRAVATPNLRAEPPASRRLGVFGAWFSQCHLHASSPNRPTTSAFVRPCALRALRDGPGIPESGRRSKRRRKRKIGGGEAWL